jgi:Kef-type K+ transport system membrane component KefB
MSSGLILILIVAAAYLAARIAFRYLAQRFMITSGAEYLVLGILLGPHVSGLISASVVDSFGPFMTLAIGWMGAVIGVQFFLPQLIRIRAPFYQVAFLESLLSFLVIAGVLALTLAIVYDQRLSDAILPAAALGAIGTASSLTGVALVMRRASGQRALLRQLQVATGMDAAVAITTFGLLLCILHVPPPRDIRPPTATEWAVICVGIGAFGGALFHLFLGRERNPDRLFIAITGAITLASGAAAYLRLSPLLPTMIIGAILVNTSKSREEVKAALASVQQPLYFVLLIFAGAAWRPTTARGWLIPVAVFFFIRVGAKLGSARLSARMSGMLPALGPDWGRALLGQGALAVAIALNYRIYDDSRLPNVVFTAAIASVLLTDLTSAHFVQSAVRRLTHRRERERASRGVVRVPSAETAAADPTRIDAPHVEGT